MIIYLTTNTINNKIYVGQHTGNNLDYLGSGKYVKRALKKYGSENFKRETLQECTTQNELDAAEIHWIKTLNSTNKEVGYNLELGGRGGVPSEETKAKMSIAQKGTFKSNKTKAKMSKSSKGRPKTIEARRNMGLARRNISDVTRRKLSDYAKKRTYSDDTIDKMRIASKGKRWICKDDVAIRIKGDEVQPYLNNGWTYGRKKK